MNTMRTGSDTREEQYSITCDVFQSVADLQIVADDQNRLDRYPCIGAMVHYDEGRNGGVLLTCSIPLAFLVTEKMLAIPRPSAVTTDVHDCVAELANMVGGNLKGLVAENSDLSIPTVLRDELCVALAKSDQRKHTLFMRGGEFPLSVALFGPITVA